jgi:YD repeat-containing protein
MERSLPRRGWDAHYRPRAESLQSFGVDTRNWIYRPDGWLASEVTGAVAFGQAYARDAAGHVTQMYDSNNLSLVPPPVSGQYAEYTYRSDGQLATKTEHTVTTTFSYDDAGGTLNPLGWTDTVGRSMAYLLDAKGNVTQTSDGTATTHATYDAHNRVTETSDALGNATTYGYNAAGCGCSQDSLVTSIHTPDLPAGVDWLMAYDGDGRLASVTDPHSFMESYAYETTGELKKITDKLLRDTSWTHDQLGRVASMVDTLGRSHGNLYTIPSSGAWTGPTLMAGSGDATASTTSLSTPLRAGDYQIGQNAYRIQGQPAAITLYRDVPAGLHAALRSQPPTDDTLGPSGARDRLGGGSVAGRDRCVLVRREKLERVHVAPGAQGDGHRLVRLELRPGHLLRRHARDRLRLRAERGDAGPRHGGPRHEPHPLAQRRRPLDVDLHLPPRRPPRAPREP